MLGLGVYGLMGLGFRDPGFGPRVRDLVLRVLSLCLRDHCRLGNGL